MGIEEVIIAARSPWQSPYVERVIGSIRRECLDNVVVLSERHLRRILKDYLTHHHRWRCHQSLEMDRPEPRPVQPSITGESDQRSHMLDCASFACVHRPGGAQRRQQEFSGRTAGAVTRTTDRIPAR
jgi:hypothetical protein